MYLVTGATGFVGTRLVNALKAESATIRTLSRNKMDGVDNIICDLKSESVPGDLIQGVNTIFHLAGYAHDTQNTSEAKHLCQVINVDATVRLAKLASISGVKKFVFLSSVKASGSSCIDTCITEDDQSEPEGIYGKSKREAELKILEIGHNSGMSVTILRSSLVYGPDVKGNLKKMLSGIKKGLFPPLPETRNCRSMVHVDDLIRALLLVDTDKRSNGEIYNVTDGVPHSSREIYEVMCETIGKSIPRWQTPKFLFELSALLGILDQSTVNKLFANEYYSSQKLCSIGFSPRRELLEMNETSF